MTNLGVFRDDFYNAIHILPASQANAGPTTTGTLIAQYLAGALEDFITVGNGAGSSQTYTTDTAVNIIAQLNAAVNAAYKANVGGFASGLGAQPAVSGMPNFFNTSFTVDIVNQGTTAASTLAAGTGVTIISPDAGLTPTSIPAAAAANTPYVCRYVVTVTSAQTVTFNRVQ
jgi:hypothetical protein